MLYLYFCGICMGAADLVPGISGGTIAFIMGFYYPLLESLKTINGQNLKQLFQCNLSSFISNVAWKFLLPLGAGITTSFIFLSSFIHFILLHDVYKNYLYALFTGLVIASTYFCLRQVKEWRGSSILLLLLGSVTAYAFTGPALSSNVIYVPLAFIDPWLIICGMLAISAMLLPGISGSYVLTLMGIYPSAIAALSHLILSVKAGSFDLRSFSLLFSLFIGIILGLFSFARVVSWLLRKYPDITLSLLTGFMIGGLRSIWPFSAESSVHDGLFSAFFGLVGFALVLVIEAISSKKVQQNLG